MISKKLLGLRTLLILAIILSMGISVQGVDLPDNLTYEFSSIALNAPEINISWDGDGSSDYSVTRYLKFYDEEGVFQADINPVQICSPGGISHCIDSTANPNSTYNYQVIVNDSIDVDSAYQDNVFIYINFYSNVVSALELNRLDSTQVFLDWSKAIPGFREDSIAYNYTHVNNISIFEDEILVANKTGINVTISSYTRTTAEVGSHTYRVVAYMTNGENSSTNTATIVNYAAPVLKYNYTNISRAEGKLIWNLSFNASYEIDYELNATYEGITTSPSTGGCVRVDDLNNCSFIFLETDYAEPWDRTKTIVLSIYAFHENYLNIQSELYTYSEDIPSAAPIARYINVTSNWTADGHINYTLEYDFYDKDTEDTKQDAKIKWYTLNETSEDYDLKDDTNKSYFVPAKVPDNVLVSISLQDSNNQWGPWINYSVGSTDEMFYEEVSSFVATTEITGNITLNWTYSSYGNKSWNSSQPGISEINITRHNGSQDEIFSLDPTDGNTYFIDNNSVMEGVIYNYTIQVWFSNGEYTSLDQTGTIEGNRIPKLAGNVSIIFDRQYSQTEDYVTISINVTDSSKVNLLFNVRYEGQGGITRNTGDSNLCTEISDNLYNCQAIFTQPDGNLLNKLKTINFTNMQISEFGNTEYKLSIPHIIKPVPNAKPWTTVHGIEFREEGENTYALCNYSILDKDGDLEQENKSIRLWEIDNEGQGNFIPIIGQDNKTLAKDYFDNGDILRCTVNGHDGENYSEQPDTSLENIFSENLPPYIYYTTTSTSLENPGQFGEAVTFITHLIDPDGNNLELEDVIFCREDQELDSGSETTLSFDETNTQKNELWLFKENLGLSIEEISIKVRNLTNSAGNLSTYSKPVYSIFIYESDTYNETNITTLGAPVIVDKANILVNNTWNKFIFDNTIPTKDYYSIKICVDEDFNGECDAAKQNAFEFQASTTVTDSDKYFILGNITRFITSDIRVHRDTGEDNGEYCGNLRIATASSAGDNIYTTSSILVGSEFLNNSLSIQKYTVFAFDQYGEKSSRTGDMYINHPPTIKINNVSLYSRDVSPAVIDWTIIDSTNNSIGTNESVSCNFTVEDVDTVPEWADKNINYSVSWWFKEVGDENWVLCNGNRGCVGSESIHLAYASTREGDEWVCRVTPQDKFITGKTINSTSFFILDNPDETDATLGSPNALTIDDDSNDQTELKYVGDTLTVSLAWNDADSSEFNIYICQEDAGVTDSGCLWNQLYREVHYAGAIGNNNRQIEFEIPEENLERSGVFNYTVHIYDETGLATSMNESAFVVDLDNVSIKIINYNGTIFTDNESDISESMKCNLSFLRNQVPYTNANLSTMIQTDKIEIHWFENYIERTDFKNAEAIAYSQTVEGEQWTCQIKLIQTSAGVELNSNNIVTIVNKGVANSFAPNITAFTAPAKIAAGETIDYNVEWFDQDADPVKIFICNSSKIELSGCIDRELSNTFDFVSVNKTLQYTPELFEETVTAYVAIFDTKGLKTPQELNFTTTIVPDVYIQNREIGSESNSNIKIIGRVESETPQLVSNATMDIWTYGQIDYSDPYPLKVQVNTSQYNPKLETLTIVREIDLNDSFIYVEKETNELRNVGKYVGFSSHSRDNYTHYFVNNIITNSSEYTIINLSEGVEQAIHAGTTFNTYDTINESGRFEKMVPLFNDTNNYILFKIKGYEQQLSEIIFKDTTDPNSSISLNKSYFTKNQKIIVNVTDNYNVNESSIKITLDNGTHNDTYNYSQGVLSLETDNLSMLQAVSHQVISNNLTTFEFMLTGLQTGNYEIIVYAEDDSGNNHTTTYGSYDFNNSPLEITELSTKDGITLKRSELNSFNITLEWNVSELNNFSLLTYELYEDKIKITEGEVSKASLKSDIQLYHELKDQSMYYVMVQVTSTWGVISNTYRSPDIKYIETPVEVSEIEIIDRLTGWNESLRSNEIEVSWSVEGDERLLEYMNISLMGDDEIIDTIITTNLSAIFVLDNPENYSEYYAKVKSESIANVSATYNTHKLEYDDNNSLFLNVSSDNLFMQNNNEMIAYNSLLQFEINVVNGNEWNWSIIDWTTESHINSSNKIFDSVYDRTEINISATGLTDGIYKLDVDAKSNFGYEPETVSYILIKDDMDPIISEVLGTVDYYNDDMINITFKVSDERFVREAHIMFNQTKYAAEELSSTLEGNDEVKTYSVKVNASKYESGTSIPIKIVGKDFAGNQDTESHTIIILNRPPENISQIYGIYWFKEDVSSEFNIGNFFGDIDQDSIFFAINDTPTYVELYIGKATGIIKGGLRRGANGWYNLTINVSDKQGEVSQFEIPIYAANGTCEDYEEMIGYRVGFNETCEDVLPTPDNEVVTPPPTGGNTNNNNNDRTSGTRSSAYIPQIPITVTKDKYISNIYNFELGDTKSAVIPGDFALDKITFTAVERIPYAKIIVSRIMAKPIGTNTLDNVYQYLEIDQTNLDGTFTSARLSFSVDKYNLQGISRDNAAAYRWHNNQWEEYPLTYKSEDLEYYYYTTEVPGFSYWAIARKQVKAEELIEDPLVEEKLEVEDEVEEEPDTERPDRIEPSKKSNNNNVKDILLFGGLLLVAGGFIAAGLVMNKNKGLKIKTASEIMQEGNQEIDPLPEYVRRQLKKGGTKEQVTEALVKAGWNLEDIEKCFNEIEHHPKKTINMALVDKQLTIQIRAKYDNGFNKKHIESDLRQQQLSEPVIESNMHYVEAIEHLEEQVGIWKSKGYTLAEIKTHLLELNWPVMTIYDILKRFK